MKVLMADFDSLLCQAAPGDPRLCEALMVDYFDFIYHLSYSILRDPAEADDAAQETFLQATLHLNQYQVGTNVKNWLAKIAVNTCRGRIRRAQARQRLQNTLQDVLSLFNMQSGSYVPSPEDHAIQNERRRTLKKAVDSLDEKHRIPVLLRYVQGMSVPEIAEILDLSEGTVHSRLHYAHKKLRDRLGGMAEELKDSSEVAL